MFNNLDLGSSVCQLDLFGGETRYYTEQRALRFCVKQHLAEKAGLHYDLRLQFDDVHLKSFAVKPGISMNPDVLSAAVLVEDHEMNAFRREGTILDGTGQGPVLHFDEGYFTIQGVENLKELRKAFLKGMAAGKVVLLLDGYKIKGEFIITRNLNGSYTDWIIQKADDEYASKEDILLQDKSILTGYTLAHYLELYKGQRDILSILGSTEKANFIKVNNGESFKYKNLKLPIRKGKLLPYD